MSIEGAVDYQRKRDASMSEPLTEAGRAHVNCDAYECRCPEGPRESTTDVGRCGRCGGDWLKEPGPLGGSENAEARLLRARRVLIDTGYFTEDEVGHDIAPRIIELLEAVRVGDYSRSTPFCPAQQDGTGEEQH